MPKIEMPEGYLMNAKGHLVPEHMVPPAKLLEDQTVRKIIDFARALSAQIARFKGHTFDDVATFMDLLAERYDVKKGGPKGNFTLSSFDDLERVQVQVQDRITFGPELQVAKAKLDEVIAGWTGEADPKIKALVDHAFDVDKEGRINRAALFSLRNLEIDDEGWRAAMRALTESIRVIGSTTYVRFRERADHGAPWVAISIDIAAVQAPAPPTMAAPAEAA